MKNIFKFSAFLLLAILVVSGCSTKNEEDIFKFKDSSVGDNSAIGNIVNHLQKADHFKDFELKTKNEPYGMILNYDLLDEGNYKKIAIHNATFIFALVQNVDWITFNFEDQEYKITRESLQDWYGENLSELESESETEELIQKYLKDDDKIKQLFN